MTENTKKMEWIPITERLPESDKDVIISYKNWIRIGYYHFDPTEYEPPYEELNETGWYESENMNRICDQEEIIAWMPLPDPYKVEHELKKI